MTNFSNLSVDQLRRAVEIKEQIERLQKELDSLSSDGSGARAVPSRGRRGGRRGISAAGRAAIAAAQRARWAKFKRAGSHAAAGNERKKKRAVDAATRARLAAVARARWAKAKAAGRSGL